MFLPIFKGLRYGSDELKLVRLDDAAFQVKMNELNRYFEELCKEILLIREKGYENTNIIEMSETFLIYVMRQPDLLKRTLKGRQLVFRIKINVRRFLINRNR